MQLQLQTWVEVETYLRSSRGIILPIGSTEQHGPIGLDRHRCDLRRRHRSRRRRCRRRPRRADDCGRDGPASSRLRRLDELLRPSTLIAVLRDMVELLVRHGFERFYFVNGHGGNIATVTAALSEIYAARSLPAGKNVQPVKCRLRNWWQNRKCCDLAKELYGDAEGSHATPSEVAVTQFVYPDSIKSAPLDPPVAPWGRLHRCRRLPPQFPRRPNRVESRLGNTRSGPPPLRRGGCCA